MSIKTAFNAFVVFILLSLCIQVPASADGGESIVPTPPGQGTYQEVNADGGITVGGTSSSIEFVHGQTISNTTDGALSYSGGVINEMEAIVSSVVYDTFGRSYQMLPSDFAINVSLNGGFYGRVNLPTGVQGQICCIKSNLGYQIIIAPKSGSGDTIDGLASLSIARDQTVIVQWDDTDWKILSFYSPRVVELKTADYILVEQDRFVIVTGTATMTLPAAPPSAFMHTIKCVSGTTTIDRNGQAIDGLDSNTSLGAGDSKTFLYDSTSWRTIGGYNAP